MEYGNSGQGRNQGQGNNPERRPTNTGLITEFRRVSQMVQNNTAAEKSRKTSRITKGLNPDVPRPVNQNPRNFYLIQLHLRTKNKPKTERQMRKHPKFQRWTSTEFLFKNCVTGSAQISKQVKKYLNSGLTTDQAMKRNAEEGDNKLPEKKKEPGWLKFLK